MVFDVIKESVATVFQLVSMLLDYIVRFFLQIGLNAFLIGKAALTSGRYWFIQFSLLFTVTLGFCAIWILGKTSGFEQLYLHSSDLIHDIAPLLALFLLFAGLVCCLSTQLWLTDFYTNLRVGLTSLDKHPSSEIDFERLSPLREQWAGIFQRSLISSMGILVALLIAGVALHALNFLGLGGASFGHIGLFSWILIVLIFLMPLVRMLRTSGDGKDDDDFDTSKVSLLEVLRPISFVLLLGAIFAFAGFQMNKAPELDITDSSAETGPLENNDHGARPANHQPQIPIEKVEQQVEVDEENNSLSQSLLSSASAQSISALMGQLPLQFVGSMHIHESGQSEYVVIRLTDIMESDSEYFQIHYEIIFPTIRRRGISRVVPANSSLLLTPEQVFRFEQRTNEQWFLVGWEGVSGELRMVQQ